MGKRTKGSERVTVVRVADMRNVKADVRGAPLLFNYKGKRPMTPREIFVSWPFGDERAYICVGGKLVKGKKRGQYVEQDFFGAHGAEAYARAPKWARKFAEQHRPGVHDGV